MLKGTDPKSDTVQALAVRWKALMAAFTGGSPEIKESLTKMYRAESAVRERAGIDQALQDYLGQMLKEDGGG